MPRLLKLLLLLLPILGLLAVALDTPYHVLGGGELFGVSRTAERPPFTWSGFWSGRFQADFEAWLEQQLSLKAAMVRTDNTLNWRLFHDISAHTGIPIVVGKENTLFEMNYINNHNGVSELKGDPPPRSPYSVAEQTRLVARAARAFRALDIDFMVLFYPVKTAIWSHRVDPSYVLPGGPERADEGYRELLAGLRAAKVPVVDGAAEFSKLFAQDPAWPLYNRGGTHWTDLGACQVAKLVVGKLRLANPRKSKLRCRRGREHLASGGDTDLAQLINVWDYSDFLDPIPSVSARLSKPLPGGPRTALIVGTSYSQHLAHELTEAGVFRHVYRLPYYRHDRAPEIDWSRAASRQVVIFEQWEWSYFTANITEFVEDLALNDPRFASALQAAGSTRKR